MYIFLRETQIMLEYGAGKYVHLDTTSTLSCDQTFKEVSINRRTLHNKNHFFKHKKIRANNTISGSITLYLTKNKRELLFWELAGWSNFGGGLAYPDFENIIPESFSIVMLNANGSYRLNNCAITAIDMSFTKQFCGEMTVSFEASSLEPTMETRYSVLQGEHLSPTPINTVLGNHTIQAMSAGISFTRDITYLNSETVHNSEDLVSNSRCIITDANFSINVTAYAVNPILDEIDNIDIKQNGVGIYMNNALITKRNTINEIYQCAFDITPTIQTSSIILNT